jgi:sec-independent protein translocase protein TatC
MADSWEEETPPLEEEAEEGGGPVKSFLEHLEDLRWVIIKTVAVVMVAMVVCLLGAGYVVEFLKRPLEKARQYHPATRHYVSVWFETNLLKTFYLDSDQVGALDFGTNRSLALSLKPMQVGTNLVLALTPLSEPPAKVEDRPGPRLIFLDPISPFMSALKIAFFAGLAVAFPFVLYFVGDFVVPALKKNEKKYFSRALLFGIGLFMLGSAFCYFVVLPLALRTAEAYSYWLGVGVTDWRAETYFSLVVIFMLAMGLAFELPVVLLALVKVGILDYPKLAAARRYSIVIAVVVGALLTPPDVVTQIMMAIPLVFLYELTVWIAWYWHRRDLQRAAREKLAEGE